MKQISRKLFISAFLVVIFAFVLGTTTYAWFTLGNTATVSAFDAQVTSGEGFEISLNDENWYSTIPSSVMNAAISDSFRFVATTTTDGVSGFQKFSSSGALTSATANADYLEFVIHFRSAYTVDSPIPVISWKTADLYSATTNGVSWVSDVDSFTINDNGSNVIINDDTPRWFKAANAARISVVDNATVSPEASVVFELPASSWATVYSGNVCGIQGDLSDLSGTDNHGDAGSVNYYYEKKGGLPNPTGIENVNLAETVTAGLDANPIVTMERVGEEAYYTGSVTIRIWIEGWDPDCFNAIFTDLLMIELGFEKAEE